MEVRKNRRVLGNKPKNPETQQQPQLSTMAAQDADIDDDDEEMEDQEESPPVSPRTSTQLFLSSINSTLVIEQIPLEGISHKIWPAATSLVTLLDRGNCKALSELFQVRLDNNVPYRILELGSGTGLVGIAAAAILGANVTVTDLPHVLPNLQLEIDANAGILQINGGSVNAAELSWGEYTHMEALGREYDYILASDVVYRDEMFDPLLKTLRWFMQGTNIVFLMAHLKRWKKKEKHFWAKARKDFIIKHIHTDEPIDGNRVGVKLYKFVAKTAVIV